MRSEFSEILMHSIRNYVGSAMERYDLNFVDCDTVWEIAEDIFQHRRNEHYNRHFETQEECVECMDFSIRLAFTAYRDWIHGERREFRRLLEGPVSFVGGSGGVCILPLNQVVTVMGAGGGGAASGGNGANGSINQAPVETQEYQRPQSGHGNTSENDIC